MNELLTQIQDVYAAFSTDAALQIEKNNNLYLQLRDVGL